MAYTLQQVAEHSTKECALSSLIPQTVINILPVRVGSSSKITYMMLPPSFRCVLQLLRPFLPKSPQKHPGGSKIILKYAGKDATDAFSPFHPPGIIDAQLSKDKYLGRLDQKDIKERKEQPKTKDELRTEREQRNKPRLSKMHNLQDLEVGLATATAMGRPQLILHQDVARKILPYKALAYYSSAADDEIGLCVSMGAFTCLTSPQRCRRTAALSPGSSSFPASCVASPPSTLPPRSSGFLLVSPSSSPAPRSPSSDTPSARSTSRGRAGAPASLRWCLPTRRAPTPSLPRPGCRLTSRSSSNCTRTRATIRPERG